MKLHQHLKNAIVVLTITSLIFACSESPSDELAVQDEDMTTAIALADDYLNESNARFGSFKSVTVLNYVDGKLYFATNSDDINGYQEINEETITAQVKPGEFIFWFAGKGMKEIVGIEFDAVSESSLISQPFPFSKSKIWVTSIDENVSVGTALKYDILYKIRGGDGSTIILDPKIRISQ